MCPVYGLARSGILLANHASYIDPIVLMAAIPAEFRFIAKRALADYPLIGTVIRKAEHSTIETSRMIERLAGAEELTRRLHAGELLMVFPEGTRHGPIDVTIGAPHQPEAQGWPEMVRLPDRVLDDIARGSGESAGARPTAS
jgi:1-acyl-sn-glycerol-3-phosphate acyltransferase